MIDSVNSMEISCITPPSAYEETYDIVVTSNAVTESYDGYTYDGSSTPSVTDLSPTTVSNPKGGETLTITGTAFGTSVGSVKICGRDCSVSSWADASIVCILPENSDNECYPVIEIPGNGFADVQNVSPISYKFRITEVSPSVGSLVGGTQVKISGEGFTDNDCDGLTVHFGDKYICEITECMNTYILCDTKRVTQEKMVSNLGSHPKFGIGYKWNPMKTMIYPGDRVTWQWSLGSSSADKGINVFEAISSDDLVYDNYGFHSGPKSQEGQFSQVFSGLGVTQYASDVVEEGSSTPLILSGSVEVGLPEDDSFEVDVRFSDVLKAKHVIMSNVTSVYTPNVNCSDGVNTLQGNSNSSSFKFSVSYDATPIITSVQLDQGSMVSVNHNRGHLQGKNLPTFNITGHGFGGNSSCQNVVMIGSSECQVSNFTQNSITCSIIDPLPSEESHSIQVSRLNHGFAANQDKNSAVYFPVSYVSSISPLEGSIAGGNILMITGSGLISSDDTATVLFVGPDQMPHDCAIQSKTDSMIECQIPTAYANSFAGQINATIFVRIGMHQLPPAEIGGGEDSFIYTFKESLAPVVDSIDANSSILDAGEGSVQISGSGFGTDLSNVKVSLVSLSVSLQRSVDLHERYNEIRIDHRPLNKLHMSTFFQAHLSRQGVEEIRWKRAGSGNRAISAEARNFHKREIALNPRHSGVALVFDDDYEGDERMSIMEQESYWNFLHRHKRSTLQRSMEKHQRSIVKHRFFRQAMAEEQTQFEGSVTSLTENSIEVDFVDIPAGSYALQVTLISAGNSLNNASLGAITSQGSVTSVVPSEGSILGGQSITINGNGFHSIDNTWVTIGSVPCQVESVSINEIICITGSEGSEELNVDIEINSGNADFPRIAYNYSRAATPSVTALTPNSGVPGDSITATGTSLANVSMVLLDDFECTISASSDTTVTFNIPEIPGGVEYSVTVLTADLGYAQVDVSSLSVLLGIDSLAPIEGSKGGGSSLVITGFGFDTFGTLSVTVCDKECIIQGNVSTDTLTCLTPIDDTIDDETICEVKIFQDSVNVTSSTNFTYLASLTPSITLVSPNSGGSGGGTRVTVTGTGFESSGNVVSIDGSICDIVSESETEITCDTNSHQGSGTFPVEVEVPGKGNAAIGNNGTFRYVDRWSSIWTWGGLGTPQEGEFIVIEEGQEIVLDVTTPKLAFLLLNGGHLIFEREEDGLVLNSEFILLLNDGVLEVGTEEEPYMNDATIMLHGHVRCIELPIYGCKVLGVRKGALELHGRPVNNTWTHLAITADANSTEITLVDDVSDWQVGDDIIIASTNHRHSMAENEKHRIASIDGNTLTLESPLQYKHLSLTQTFGTTTVQTRAEVGRLTRNVKYLGSRNEQFLETIPACEKKFDSNQFATQSCFNGKFGEELGSDEFGAVTLYAVKNKNMFEAQIHLSYVEFNWVGQAFRVGRYPIHFHMMGNVTGSYARGCAVHNSFNRAMTIHGITGVLAERIVTYDIKGLSFFIEDGKEENNIIRRNLAVYTKQSSSLLNPDVTPAAFWIVNPNNQVYENSAAGGTHFGFWYRIQKHPDGPSEDFGYCSNNVPLGVFRDNSAHSFGWYGLWIFSMAGYFPKDGTPEGGYCNGENYVPAVYERFTAWRCERGAEVVFSGPVQFKDFKVLDNEKAGLEFVEVDGGYGDQGPGAFGGIVVGHSMISEDDSDPEYCTHEGYIGPKLWVSNVNGTEFYNFNRSTCYALATCSQCTVRTAPFAVLVENITFENSPNKVTWKWEHGGSFIDVDGTLTGTEGQTVITKSPLYPPECVDAGPEYSGGVNGSICDSSIKFSRMAWNHILPSALDFAAVIATTQYGNDSLPWRKKDITHKAGWNGLFPQNESVNLEWEDFTQMTNISYDLSAYSLDSDGDFMLISHTFNQRPDKIGIVPGAEPVFTNESLMSLPDDTSVNGEYYFDNDTLQITYILSHRVEHDRRKRGLGLTSFPITDPRINERRSNLDIFRCLYTDCLPPPPPTYPTGRPDVIFYWSQSAIWTELGISKPVDGDDLELPGLYYLVVDEPLPQLGAITLYDYATLELQDSMDHVINCTHIFLHGGQLVAGELVDGVVPLFEHSITINLLGDTTTYDYPLPNGPVMGAKAIGVFGKLLMNGAGTASAWTKLAQSALSGTNTLVLSETVDWEVGATIMVTTTSFLAHETERLTIDAISDDGLTITTAENLMYDHTVNLYSVDGQDVNLAGEVALLSRNIKFVGAPFDEQEEYEFGCRVIVGKFTREGIDYIGEALLNNIEFVNCGQRGFVENYDARFALAFMNVGDLGKRSTVTHCSFNYNYNTAIGAFGSDKILFEDNVVYRALGKGIEDEGIRNKWHYNLVSYVLYEGIHLDQPLNFNFHSCFTMTLSFMAELIGNVAAGCERGGIDTEGEPCDLTGEWADYVAPWSGNEVRAAMHGVRTKASFTHQYGQTCASFNNFLVWNVYDYGFYIQSSDELRVVNATIADSGTSNILN